MVAGKGASLGGQEHSATQGEADMCGPSLLLIFLHDKGWLAPSDASRPASSLRDPSFDTPHRPFSPSPSARTGLSDPSRLSIPHSRPGQRFEFLLFSYMLRFVHREGRTGDFARAGLLFLFDIAFVNQNDDFGNEGSTGVYGPGDDPLQMARNALAEYILDGDFADVMAAAVGAVYSLLPRKVRIPGLAEQGQGEGGEEEGQVGGNDTYLGSGRKIVDGDDENESGQDDDELPSTQDIEVHDQLDLLLKLFGLMQDIVNRCTSLHIPTLAPPTEMEPEDDESLMQALGYAIADSILDAMQRSLLVNVLYPSILECSPTDGSGVAVMTYLDILLRNLDDGPLLSRFLEYLLDLETRNAPLPEDLRQARMGSDRFTLKDLILDNLRSDVSSAQAAAARLARTLLVEHCACSAKGLLSTVGLHTGRSYAQHQPASSAYNAILVRLDPSTASFQHSSAFSTYFADAYTQVSADRCLQISQLHSAFLEQEQQARLAKVQSMSCAPVHAVSPSDAVSQALLEQMRAFLSNNVETNVALTGAVLALGSCGHRCLDGLVTYAKAEKVDLWAKDSGEMPSDSRDVDVRSDDSSDDFALERSTSTLLSDKNNTIPAVLSILQSITDQINTIRTEIADFDALLADRRRALMFNENIDEALTAALDNDLGSSAPIALAPTPKGTPAKSLRPAPSTPLPKKGRTSLAGSIKDFFSPKKRPSPSPIPTPGDGDSSMGTGTPSEVGTGGQAIPRAAVPTACRDPVFHSGRTVTIAALGIAESPGTPLGIGGPILVDDTKDTTDMTGHESRMDPITISLDTVLDNTVILEEFIKEIMALLVARRVLETD